MFPETPESNRLALPNQDPVKPTNMNDRGYAQKMNAYLNRQQWEDYKTRFAPVEDQLINETMGRELLDKRLGQVSAIADNSFDSSMVAAAQRMQRYGVSQDQQQSSNMQRNSDIQKSTAIADARNNTRTEVFDRNMDTIAGGSSAAGQAIR